MHCQHCGTNYPPNAVPPYCVRCGTPFPPAAARREWWQQPATWIVGVAVLVTAAILITALAVSGGEDDGTSPVADSPTPSAPGPTGSQSSGSGTRASVAPPPTAAPSSRPTAASPTKVRTRTVTAGPTGRVPTVPGSLSSVFERTRVTDPGPYASSNGNGGLYFVTPSGNIGCYIFVQDGNSAECTIGTFDFDPPTCRRAATVTQRDDGSAASIGCASAKPASGKVLGYDRTVAAGRIACASRESGVTCADTRTGNGFTLSRERWTSVR